MDDDRGEYTVHTHTHREREREGEGEKTDTDTDTEKKRDIISLFFVIKEIIGWYASENERAVWVPSTVGKGGGYIYIYIYI